jgi:hypothetical protein
LNSKNQTLVSFILIILLLFNSGVNVLLYFSSTKIVKKTIHYLIENDELEKELMILSISKKDIEEKIVKFEWVEEKEFRYNGMMYDVKKDLSDNDSLRFLCYLDEHENLLEKLFSRFSDSNKDKTSSQPQKFVFAPFLGLFYQKTECMSYSTQGITFSSEISYKIIHNFKKVPTPPPQTEFNFS